MWVVLRLSIHTSDTSSTDGSSTDHVQIIPTVHDLDPSRQIDRLFAISCFLSTVAHAAGWDPYCLRHLTHVSWVGSVLCRSCATSHNGS